MKRDCVRIAVSVFAFCIATVVSVPNLAAEDPTGDDANSDTGPSIKTGLTYDEGKYGARQATRVTTVPTSIFYDTENFEIEAMLPYTKIVGPAGSTAGRVRHRTTQARPVVTERGLGDSTVTLTGDLLGVSGAGLGWDLGATAKFATGDVHKGLGTGANDYTLFTDVTETIRRFALIGTAGYTWLGSKGLVYVQGYQEDLKFKDAAFGNLDGSVTLHDRTKIGLTFYAQQPIERKTPEEESTIYLAVGLGKRIDLNFYTLKGFTKASPDQGVGATIKAFF